jgi:hypothetical protein
MHRTLNLCNCEMIGVGCNFCIYRGNHLLFLVFAVVSNETIQPRLDRNCLQTSAANQGCAVHNGGVDTASGRIPAAVRH